MISASIHLSQSRDGTHLSPIDYKSTTTATASSGKPGLSPGAIAGIVISVIIGVPGVIALMVIVIAWIVWRQKVRHGV